jgi:uncharacterized Zn-binding protein involved in type VI secretion
MPPAARQGDMIRQDTPHCHAPIHPPAPVPTPVPHPSLPLAITSATATSVMINSLPAAVVGSMSMICSLPSCVPNGPGVISMGSPKVMIQGRPAARVNDMTAHAACVAPIPAPVGKVMPPGSPTVMIN